MSWREGLPTPTLLTVMFAVELSKSYNSTKNCSASGSRHSVDNICLNLKTHIILCSLQEWYDEKNVLCFYCGFVFWNCMKLNEWN